MGRKGGEGVGEDEELSYYKTTEEMEHGSLTHRRKELRLSLTLSIGYMTTLRISGCNVL